MPVSISNPSKSSPSESAGVKHDGELLRRVVESAQHLYELEPPTSTESFLSVISRGSAERKNGQRKASIISEELCADRCVSHEESMTRGRAPKAITEPQAANIFTEKLYNDAPLLMHTAPRQ